MGDRDTYHVREDLIDPRHEPPRCLRSIVLRVTGRAALEAAVAGDGGPDPAPMSPFRVRRTWLADDHPDVYRLNGEPWRPRR